MTKSVYEYHTLPNGIKIILSHTPSRVTYSGVYINVGSRDERGIEGILPQTAERHLTHTDSYNCTDEYNPPIQT